MKKKLTIIGLLGFTFLFGCTQTQNEVNAKIPKGFYVIGETEIITYTNAIEIKHEKTGCHYLYVDGVKNGGVTQMLDKDGLPYCD